MQYTIKTVKRHGKLHNITVAKFKHKNTGWRARRVAPFHNNKSNISLAPGVNQRTSIKWKSFNNNLLIKTTYFFWSPTQQASINIIIVNFQVTVTVKMKCPSEFHLIMTKKINVKGRENVYMTDTNPLILVPVSLQSDLL